MNKVRTTTKEIKDNYHILSVGYCKMQYLLKFQWPIAYNAGLYGWNYDVYDYGGVVITTGYRQMPKSKNMNTDNASIDKYEEAARNLFEVRGHEAEQEINRLLSELIENLKIK